MHRKTVQFLALTVGLAASLTSSVLAQPILLIHPTTQSWKYLAGTTDPGSPGWEATTFDDSSWLTGTGLFGNETQYPYPNGTFIPGPSNLGTNTIYFRTHFNWSGSTAGVVLVGTNYVDDGDVVYLNGVEIFRFNMPAFPAQVTYATFALAAPPAGTGANGNAYAEPVISAIQISLDGLTNGNANPLMVGDNVLAVEVHNNGAGSSDTEFGMALYAQQSSPPEFTTQPTNQTVKACTTVRLVAAATGIPNPTFYWTKDSVTIDPVNVNATANTATLVITNFQAGDEGSYVSYAANAGGTVASATAVLTYVADSSPPVVTSVANIDSTTVVVTFDEPLDPASIGEAYYTSFVALISDPSSQLPLSALEAVPGNPNQVRVVTSDARTPGLYYFVSLFSLTDLCGPNPLITATSNQIPVSTSFQEGVNGFVGTHDTDVRSTTADQVRGAEVGNLSDNNNPVAHALIRFDNIFGTSAGQIPFGASISSARLVFYTANNSPHTHGLYRMLTAWNESATWNTMVNGIDVAGVEYLDPPDGQFVNQNTVGQYNTNDITASLRAWAEGANNFGWSLRPIGGDDGYQFASAEATAVEQRPLLIVDYVVIPAPIVIVQQPQSLTVNERQSANFNVVVTGSSPQFQWYKNNVLLPGETGSSLTIASVVPSDAGSYTVTINNTFPSSANSDAAILTVTADTLRPTVLNARGGAEASTTIVVNFSEALNPTTAQAAGNYTLLGPGGITVQSAVLNGTTVTLTLSGPRTPAENYQLRVTAVTDTAVAPNTIDPNPTTLPVSTQFELVSVNGTSWKYLQQTVLGAPQPCLDETPWTLAGFDDSAWASGNGVFWGTRTNSVDQPTPNPFALPITLDGSSVLTILNVWTNDANALQETTYYFRTTFNYPSGSTNGTSLLLHGMIDDGAVFFLNGSRIYDVRFTNNPVSCTNFTAGAATGGQGWAPALTNRGQIIGLDGLVAGENTLAVQLFQNNNTSSDVTLGVQLAAEVVSFGGAAPRLNSAYDAGAKTLTLTWTATDYALWGAPSVSGPWTLVSATSPAVVSTATGNRFFQLRK